MTIVGTGMHHLHAAKRQTPGVALIFQHTSPRHILITISTNGLGVFQLVIYC